MAYAPLQEQQRHKSSKTKVIGESLTDELLHLVQRRAESQPPVSRCTKCYNLQLSHQGSVYQSSQGRKPDVLQQRNETVHGWRVQIVNGPGDPEL